MNKIITFAFTSDCPYLDEPHTIYIDYNEVCMCGNPQMGYKKGSYSCNVSDCPYPSKDAHGRCPVYLNSPSCPR